MKPVHRTIVVACILAGALPGAWSPAQAQGVPWRQEGAGVTVWLTDAQYAALGRDGFIALQRDTMGATGYCVGPLRPMGYGTATPDPRGPRLHVVTCAFSPTRPAAAKGCNDPTGNWVHESPPVCNSTWIVTRGAGGQYVANESGCAGMQNATVAFNGSTLEIRFGRDGYMGYYRWQLDARCGSGSGDLVFTARRFDRHRSTVRRQ